MDFLKSAIEADISKKRKALEAASKGSDGTKKYISRAELERIREEEYKKKEEERIAKDNERIEKKREEQEEERKTQEKQQTKKKETESNSDGPSEVETFNISREEVIRRLRAKGQPILLFGETDKQCKIRLRALELMEERSEGRGQQNDFMRKLEEMEKDMSLEILKQKGGITEEKKKPKKTDIVVMPIEPKMLHDNRDELFIRIYGYFVRTLEEWEEAMDARDEEEKRSGAGKRAAVTQQQTAEYIKPLFRLLKKRTLEPDILARVTEIAHHMQNRRYRDAQDSYLKLSIGNAPWPIGVTMVGIHERSAREKIFSSQVAHVLNDEVSRKWIQSVKRLMTFAQSKYPPFQINQRV